MKFVVEVILVFGVLVVGLTVAVVAQQREIDRLRRLLPGAPDRFAASRVRGLFGRRGGR